MECFRVFFLTNKVKLDHFSRHTQHYLTIEKHCSKRQKFADSRVVMTCHSKLRIILTDSKIQNWLNLFYYIVLSQVSHLDLHNIKKH